MDALPPIKGNVFDLPWISGGVSGLVVEASSSTVIKVPFPCPENREQLEVERKIYERISPHPYITKFLSAHEGMIYLERLQYPLRKRLWDLRDAGQVPHKTDVVRWGLQLSMALHHIHSCGVYQVDIGSQNILLDWNENVKLSDFAGSSIDGSEPRVYPSQHSAHPHMPATHPSVGSEIFALGSVLYEVETTRQPYYDKTDGQIEELFLANDFPATSSLVLGKVIQKCWKQKYTGVDQVAGDIGRISNSLERESGNALLQGSYNVGPRKRCAIYSNPLL